MYLFLCALMLILVQRLSTISNELRALGALALSVFLAMGCDKPSNKPQVGSAIRESRGPSEGLHRLIQPGDELAQIVARLGEPDQRGKWEGGDTFLYFEKGMQVNFQQGRLLFVSLYDEGVVLKPDSPSFKRYQGLFEGVSLNNTVADALRAWGEPSRFYVQGTSSEQTIALEYKDRATLTVWPPKQESSDETALRFVQLNDVRGQRLRSITVYFLNPKK